MKKFKIFLTIFLIFCLTSCTILFGEFLSGLGDFDDDDWKKTPLPNYKVIQISPSGTIYVKVNGEVILTPTYYDNGTKKTASFSYSVSPSSLGYFIGSKFVANDNVGDGTITVSLTNDSSVKTPISLCVYDGDDSYVDSPISYNNQLYYGAKKGAGSVKTSSKISVTYPRNTSFDADGFFHFKGKVSNSSCYDYAYIEVKKDNNDSLKSQYFIRGDFDTNIWLRFGKGSYTVNVCTLSKIQVDLSGNGFIHSWTYVVVDTYSVNNTRDENGQYLYPSYMVQSDNEKIAQIVANKVNSSDTVSTKAKVLHDYVVDLCSYDNDSLVSGNRKKQDALSTLNNKKGVCEGYADLLAALYRAAGIPCKVISGKGITSSGSGGHAWNNVQINGVWKLVDATWNDTGKTTKYYLINSLNGINNDHVIDNPQPKDYFGRGVEETNTIIWSNM